jgi:hypothetical protein
VAKFISDKERYPQNDSSYLNEYKEALAPAEQEAADAVLFSVTVKRVVGTVYAGGDKDPTIAAFEIIAKAGMDGEYSFPINEEYAQVVTVQTVQRK